MKTYTKNIIFIVLLFAVIFTSGVMAAPEGQLSAIGSSYINVQEYRRESYENGDFYAGYFLNGLYNGEGVYTWANGDRYEGQFLNGQINGMGRLTFYGNGQYWEGSFVQGMIDTGTGIFYYGSMGDKFDGNWINGQPNGAGVLLHPNGTTEKVIFQNGQMIGGNSNPGGKDKSIYMPDENGYGSNPFANLKIGDIVSFGAYEQDNNYYNGYEPIQWRCLDIDYKTGEALLLSVYGLDTMAYFSQSQPITWEDSEIREVLNNDFYYGAFSDSERVWITESLVVNSNNPTYGTYGGNNTKDYIYILSIDEVLHYAPTEDPRKTVPTPLARAHGAYGTIDPNCAWWWLRSPGINNASASSINSNGVLLDTGPDVTDSSGVVRPALHVKIR